MTRATVEAGVCGFGSVIKADSPDRQHAVVRLETECPNLKPLEALPLELDAFVECFSKLGESSVYAYLRGHCRHPGCPVAVAVIKALEVECGLALPRDASVRIEKEQP
jgi:hypothetical protein